MRIELEPSLDRWVEARILDRQQADRIRQFESEQVPRRRARWPVIMAVAFGGLMLAAGVLLFVSAHWDELSPFQRMALLVLAVGGFHLAGAFSLDRFRALGVTLHAVGTVALGGAIAMAGQIFNMQEHWPSAVLLWAVGAIAGWLLLGDWPHLALTAILVPWWLAGEWAEAVPLAQSAWPAITCGILLLAICYLSVRMPGADSREDHVRTALTWLGGLALLPATLVVAAGHHGRAGAAAPGPGMLAIGWACAILVPLGFAYAFRRNAAWMNLLAALWVVGLSFLAEARLEIEIYAWCALGAAAMIAWGIYEFRAERINLGMAGFALTIVFFFFSSVMDKLGRSASLMALGILFVGGGWYWEKLRRNLVARLVSGGVQ
jgi:MFS family permease